MPSFGRDSKCELPEYEGYYEVFNSKSVYLFSSKFCFREITNRNFDPGKDLNIAYVHIYCNNSMTHSISRKRKWF